MELPSLTTVRDALDPPDLSILIDRTGLPSLTVARERTGPPSFATERGEMDLPGLFVVRAGIGPPSFNLPSHVAWLDTFCLGLIGQSLTSSTSSPQNPPLDFTQE